jgi:hypothetical protein
MAGPGTPFFQKGNKAGPGGARKGSGRKTTYANQLKQLEIANAHGEAAKSLQFLVNLRDNPEASWELRKACADSILDRVWGRARQAIEVTNIKTADEIEAENKRFERLYGYLGAISK